MTAVLWKPGEALVLTDAPDMYPGWTVLADPAPADLAAGAPYLVVDGALVPDLATARARQRAIIKAARDLAMQDNVTVPDMPGPGETAEFQLRASTPGGRGGFDFIMGFFTRAQDAVRTGTAFSRAFKLADDRFVMFDAAQWVAIGDHIEAELQARFARGEVLLARIEAAETLAAIQAVGWTLAD